MYLKLMVNVNNTTNPPICMGILPFSSRAVASRDLYSRCLGLLQAESFRDEQKSRQHFYLKPNIYRARQGQKCAAAQEISMLNIRIYGNIGSK